MDILEENGSVDLDEREASWRKEGWSGYEGATGSSAVGAVGSTAGATAARAEGATEAVAAHGAAQTGTDYIPVVEERLNVGKRMVDSGRVRVRSYAVEEAVSENVTLHDETVQVDRRVVDRAVAPGDEALFADKVIEATETREQAVVSKDARVVGRSWYPQGRDAAHRNHLRHRCVAPRSRSKTDVELSAVPTRRAPRLRRPRVSRSEEKSGRGHMASPTSIPNPTLF